MSGTPEKRQDGASRRQTRIDKERKEKRKVRIIATSIATLLVLLFAVAMFINSKLIRRTFPAISIGDVNFAAADYDYYFMTSLNEYQNQMYSYYGEDASEQLPKTDEALSNQIFDEETGQTWAEFISGRALSRMVTIAKVYSVALAERYKLPDEDAKEIDDQIKQLKEQAEMYGFPTFLSYIQRVFGASITEGGLRKIMERDFLISSFINHKRDSFTYSADQLAAYYSENADTLDDFVFRVLAINAEPLDDTHGEDDGHEHTEEEIAEDEAANAEAVETARRLAATIASGIKNEAEFIEEAKKYDEEQYGDPESTRIVYPGSSLEYLEFADWLQDSARVRGDVMTLDNDFGAYIILYVERDKNEYKTTQMRQILILPESVNPSDFEEGEDDPEYLIAEQAAMSAAEATANSVFSQFTGGGATEAKLLELMEENSDDGTEGGFYDNITKESMTPEIDEWLFEDGRAYGDNKLIKSQYGYHIVFFMGFGDRACDVAAEEGLRAEAFSAWEESLEDSEPVTRWAFSLTQKQ